MGLGWTSSHGSGKGADAITSGLEVTWTQTPTQWSNNFFENLFKFEWVQTQEPGRRQQWRPRTRPRSFPTRLIPSKKRKPTMLTTDLSLRFDPAYEKISRRFLNDPQAFADAFARAWFKLTHRDMGRKARYLGPEVPEGRADLAGPDPAPLHHAHRRRTSPTLKRDPASGLSVSRTGVTAWASASTFRGGDKRGGANGARMALAPQKDWAVNAISWARC
jgi:catalase-peroxidase